MKKIILSALCLSLAFSCMSNDGYDEMNQDKKNPTNVSEEVLFTAATKSLVDQMSSTNVNSNVYKLLSQYFTQTTYIDQANYDLNGRNITNSHWSEMYRDVLLDLQDSKERVMANVLLSADEKAGRVAQIEVLSIYTWQQMVDSFGDVPYTQALNIEMYSLPAYDKAEVIYSDLIKRVDAVVGSFASGKGFNASADKLYGGNMAAWGKFANSLKLRIGIRLSDANPALSKATVESAVKGGVFNSNSDNAVLTYGGSTPNTNPLWLDLVQSGRQDYVAANTIVDIMNTDEDPRRGLYFRNNLGANTFKGGVYGATSGYTTNSQLGDLLHDPTFEGVLMDYAEVSFYLAEAAERNFSVGGTAANFYDHGILASLDYWGVPYAQGAAYLAKPGVAYATATGTWKQKIGTQFWLAMYNRGFEGWTVWRKFDFPKMNVAAGSKLPVPTRYTYPVSEQNLNSANWEKASNSIGGDAQTTKLFWDKF